jgi:TRAP transporter TAXI family solute receptor
VFNVQGVERGEFELAFSQGNVAYEAYTQGVPGSPRPGANLRAVAVLYVNAVQIFARREGPVRTVGSLKGRRVGLGAPGSGTEGAARVILEAYGLTPAQLEARSLSFSEVAAGLSRGSLDVGFLVASPPVPAMTAANASVGLRLLAIDPGAARLIRERYPFFRPVVVPRRTYDGQEEDVPTIGVDNLLVCRGDLDEELVYRLTKALVESLSDLARVHEAARSIDPEQAPAAPIPLHPGSARYYRERELFR